MKRLILLIALLTVSAGVVVGQSGHAGQENNLRGLKGLRLVVMFNRSDAIAETECAAIEKLVEADAIAKFKKAGIPLLRFAQEIENAGSPQLIVYLTWKKKNGIESPFETPLDAKVKLLQRVHLSRDPTIQTDLATWETFGVGGPDFTVEMTRGLVASEIDQFIRDYNAVNSK